MVQDINTHMMKYWFFKETFNMSHGECINDLAKHLKIKTYRKGSLIYDSIACGSHTYFIKKGFVKIGRQVDGEFLLKYMLGEGNIFGESKILSCQEFEAYSAIAMSDTNICLIETDKMRQLMCAYPSFNNSIFQIAGLKYNHIEQRLSSILHKDAETRIKDFIFDFVRENGTETNGWVMVSNIFSHKDIGSLTSTGRQTVNNVITKLRKTSYLFYDRSIIKIPADILA